MDTKKAPLKSTKSMFSEREVEVLSFLKEGITSQGIAEALHISKHTVDGHRRSMLKKSACKNTVALIGFCQKNGIL